jgi:hypothetical protein
LSSELWHGEVSQVVANILEEFAASIFFWMDLPAISETLLFTYKIK